MNEYATNPKDFFALVKLLKETDVNARPIQVQFDGKTLTAFLYGLNVEQEESSQKRLGYFVGMNIHMAVEAKKYNGIIKSLDTPRSVKVSTGVRDTTAFSVTGYTKDADLDGKVAFFATGVARFRLQVEDNGTFDKALREFLKS